MPKSITVQTAAGPRDIAAVWVGDNLAVHRPPLRDGAKPAPKQWAITHTASGLSMGAPLCARKDSAVALARLWDSAAGEIDARNPRGWRFLQTWQLDVAAAENRRIAPLEGPVLPDNPGPQDVAAAIAAALDSAYAPAGDEAADQFPAHETVAADLLRTGADGVEMFWRGRWWPVPTFEEVEAWALDSLAETPDGRTVEPDARDSWTRLLGVC
jgi:hypothetical protein